MKKIDEKVYLAFASLVFLLLKDLGVIHFGEEHFNLYVTLILSIFMGVGFITKPFKEDK